MVKKGTRADRIVEAFSKGNVSVSGFCKATGISPQAVSKAKRTGSMSIENLAILARMSNYDLEWIAIGVSDKQRLDTIPSSTIDLSSRIHSLPINQQKLMESILENFEKASGIMNNDKKGEHITDATVKQAIFDGPPEGIAEHEGSPSYISETEPGKGHRTSKKEA